MSPTQALLGSTASWHPAGSEHGYALTSDQILIGQMGIAAPTRNVHFQTATAVNLSAQLSNWPEQRVINELAPILMEVTQAVTVG